MEVKITITDTEELVGKISEANEHLQKAKELIMELQEISLSAYGANRDSGKRIGSAGLQRKSN